MKKIILIIITSVLFSQMVVAKIFTFKGLGSTYYGNCPWTPNGKDCDLDELEVKAFDACYKSYDYCVTIEKYTHTIRRNNAAWWNNCSKGSKRYQCVVRVRGSNN